MLGGETCMLKDDTEFFRIIYHFFADGTKLTYAAIGVGLLVAFLYFRIFFRDVSGFGEDADKAGKIPIVDKDYDYVNSKWSGEDLGLDTNFGRVRGCCVLSVARLVSAFIQMRHDSFTA